jgi:L-2,4-diaminobutyric acid acetyltransferase
MSRSEEVLVALRKIIRATDQNSKRLNRQAGLTIPQTVLMNAIASHPGATLGDITQRISLSQATVSTIIDRLEERKLVERQRNQRDKRVVNVRLTEAGVLLLAKTPAPLQQVFVRHFDNLEQQQQGAIIDSLQAVATLFGATDVDAAPILTLGSIPEQLPGKVVAFQKDREIITFRPPTALDASDLQRLVRISPPLDQNSLYCNLLQCSHFSDTAIVAEQKGKVIGFITGYRMPTRPDTLFVWQVAVHSDARRQNLAIQMLEQLLTRLIPAGVSHVETTVTEDNHASAQLFIRLADRLATGATRSCLFEKQAHFHGQHDSEWLLRIGPFDANRLTVNITSP